MTRPEVADVFRMFRTQFLDKFDHALSSQQRRALSDIVACRTSALGSHRRRCDVCDHEEVSYNSCRNRHCPKCQATKRREWLQREARNLIEVEYFHVVFTLPEALGPIALRNQRLLYGILFQAVSDAIATIAKDARHLGATVGFTAVLHTWGQTLDYHPHIHCVVPGGGLSPDESSWTSCRAGFFLPVRVLGRRFRETFIRLLERSHQRGEIAFCGKIASLATRWNQFIESLRANEWVVYAKPPFGGPNQVLKYLAKYTHRVAISNNRIASVDERQVRFRWKDYRSSRRKTMVLQGVEFVRRFLTHVVPSGFMRIRHFGFLANRVREHRLAQIRELVKAPDVPEVIAATVTADTEPRCEIEFDRREDASDPICARCRKGRLRVVEVSLPVPREMLSPG